MSSDRELEELLGSTDVYILALDILRLGMRQLESAVNEGGSYMSHQVYSTMCQRENITNFSSKIGIVLSFALGIP